MADKILLQLNETSTIFGGFQTKTKLSCPSECGKCCFKPDIRCTPYELLPLAFHLIQNGCATEFLEKAERRKNDQCILLQITDKENEHGYCSNYVFRPFICRVFGVASRINKYGVVEPSLCSLFKNNKQHFSDIDLNSSPLIDVWKKKLEGLDPNLSEKEIPINQALAFILEKVLLAESLGSERCKIF